MTNRPLIDPTQIQDIVHKARIERALYVRDTVGSGVGHARFGSLVTLVAACLAFFGVHTHTNGHHAGSGPDASRTY